MKNNPISGLDHALVLVDDLDHARDSFAAMGFTVSPRGLHEAKRGTANHTIMFRDDYVELLGVLQPTLLNAERRASIAASGYGLHGLAFRITDADAVPDLLAARGVETHTRSDFSRPVPLAGGGEALASFRTHQMQRAQFPIGMAFLCEHLTPELLWQPALLSHPNTATRIAETLAISPDPGRDAALFARNLGYEVQDDGAEAVAFPASGRAGIRLMTRPDFEACFPPEVFGHPAEAIHAGLRVLVAHMDQLRRILDANSVAWHEVPDGIAVPPAYAAGMIMVFSPA